jgi:hypothetical protein
MLPEVLHSTRPVATGNYGLATLIARTRGSDSSLVITGVCLVGAALAVFRAKRSGAPIRFFDTSAAALAAGCAVMLLSSRLAWLHYFLLAIPLVLFVLRPAPPDAPNAANTTRLVLYAVVALYVAAPSRLLDLDPLTVAWTLNAAVALLFIAALYELSGGNGKPAANSL